ncbi:cytochrome b6-f complex subunit 6 [Phormidium tenue FACHB-886]|nr:cytochrome b6-f complex subunit 6 [Phormidium tenue FACHB-886]
MAIVYYLVLVGIAFSTAMGLYFGLRAAKLI